MLKINFIQTGKNFEENAQTVIDAVNFEKNAMMLEKLDSQINTLKNRAKLLDAAEKQILDAEIRSLQNDRNTISGKQSYLKPNHDKLLEIATQPKTVKNNDGTEKSVQNNSISIRHLLRLVACEGKSSLMPYIIISEPEYDKKGLYDALTSIHVENRNINDDGSYKQTKALKESYGIVRDIVSDYAYKLFAAPIESDILKAVKVKFNNTTISHIHEAYISSYSAQTKAEKDADDSRIYGGLKTNALIKVKKVRKKGVPEYTTYDMHRFNKLLFTLTYDYICNKSMK